MKRYGIRVRLPQGDTLGAPHLLGPDWQSIRWYPTPEARDRALEEMARRLPNYRETDVPTQVLEKVERTE